MVLLPVAVPAPPHLVGAPLRDPRAELGFVVDDGHGREVVDVPAGTPEAQAEVGLLRVEEEALVEEAHLIERGAPDEQGRAHHPVDGARRVATGLRDPDLAERQEAERRDRRRRKPPRRRLQPAVGVDEARPERTDAAMRVHVRRHPVEAPVRRGRVLVQDVDVTTGRRADHGVVVGAEAGSKRLCDHSDVRERGAHRVRRPVLRGIVEHDHLDAVIAVALEGSETREQELAAVRVDDRDRDFRSSSRHEAPVQRASPRATRASRAESTVSDASCVSSHASRSSIPR